MATALAKHLAFAPTAEQESALASIARFLSASDADAFILRGAAGTGKTSLTKAVTTFLHAQGIRFHLVAPTGRAARIIGQKTGFSARTIHSLIYTPEPVDDRAAVRMVRKTNEIHEPGVYLVDEASMVSDTQDSQGTFITPHPLLTDFVDFVKQGSTRNKLLLIGDAYQLAPVNSSFSPALEASYLRTRFGLSVSSAELSEVKRQSSGSYVLENATHIREAIAKGKPGPKLRVQRLSGPIENVDCFLGSFEADRSDSAVMLAWTNRDVSWMNNACRQRLGRSGRTLDPGEPVILYRPWAGNGRWLVNGEQGIITAVGKKEVYAGLNFTEVEVGFTGDDGKVFVVSTLALDDVLESEHGLLARELEQALYHKAITDNRIFRESRRMSDDRYVGALRLRYGYALTVHKAQGGEWDRVFLHPYFNPDLRWQYTAVTRAREELYSYRHPYSKWDYFTFLN